MKTLKDLRNKAEKMTAGIEFMEDRDKGEMSSMLNLPLTIIDYGFLEGDDGEYSVLLFEGEDKHFFFGGNVITDHLKALDNEGYGDIIRKEGLPVTFESKKSKNNRWYTDAILFPDDEK